MGKMIFITSGKIKYDFKGKSLYESIELTASGKKFSHLTIEGEKEVVLRVKKLKDYKIGVIKSATSNQCLETTEIISGVLKVKVEKDPRLLPLKFELSSMFGEKGFNKLGEKKFIELRKKFLEMFYENRLVESNREIAIRFEQLVSAAKDTRKNVLLVSHAYLIQLFSIYYLVGEEIYENKDLLMNMFNPLKEPMGRLETKIIEY